MVINQLEREIYVSEIVFRTSSSVKIPRLLQRKKIVDTTFLDCSTVPTLQWTHFRIGSCGTGESA